VAAGQTIPVAFPAGSTTIGLLGSADNGAKSGAAGTLTVSYTDGSSRQIPIAFSDWTLGGGADALLPGDKIVARLPYRNTVAGRRQHVSTYAFSTSVPLQAGKSVASVTLPGASGAIHVFAIGAG